MAKRILFVCLLAPFFVKGFRVYCGMEFMVSLMDVFHP